MANTAKTRNGVEVYENKIYELADEYIDNLKESENYDDSEIKVLMRKPQPFKGMLKYIFKKLFKIGVNDIKYSNKNSKIDYGDIELIDKIWNIYTELCYKYLQNPTILNFSLLTGIDNTTIDSWKNGEYRCGKDGANSTRSKTVKRWIKECESALVDTAMTGNPGSMFLLKASYGYTEAPQQIQVINNQLPEETAADIAARHLGRSAKMPELPKLD